MQVRALLIARKVYARTGGLNSVVFEYNLKLVDLVVLPPSRRHGKASLAKSRSGATIDHGVALAFKVQHRLYSKQGTKVLATRSAPLLAFRKVRKSIFCPGWLSSANIGCCKITSIVHINISASDDTSILSLRRRQEYDSGLE